MDRVKRLGYILCCIGIATVMGYSQEKASEYVARRKPFLGAQLPRCRSNC